jgi:hypothetical protein
MPQMEKLQTYKVVCEGGLNSNQNVVYLADTKPGMATTLVNFEPSLYGGYRRINGYSQLEPSNPAVGGTGAQGKVLGVTIFNGSTIIATRQDNPGTTYSIYKWVSGGAWSKFTTGLTLTTVNIDKCRFAWYNFNGTAHMIMVDGINPPTLWDQTNFAAVTSAHTGGSFAQAGGNQALTSPKYVTMFKQSIFVAGDPTNPQIVAYSAPNSDYDWTAASGAGQINAGMDVVAIKPFREDLFVFGKTRIKKISVSGTNFVINDVATEVGCLCPDSVVEINGDLLYLAEDGFRNVAGTDRIGDVELASQSKAIQFDVTNQILSGVDLNSVNCVVIRRKSQVRCFFSNPNVTSDVNTGIIGGFRGKADQNSYWGNNNGFVWEWGLLQGIRTSCTASGYIGPQEYVLHGDFDGVVYRQESGNSFNGSNITAIYSTPYLDYGDVFVRKTLHKANVFVFAEGNLQLNVALQYDWDRSDVFNPSTYALADNLSGAIYGTAVYGTDTYAVAPLPITFTNLEGSGFSQKFTFSTSDVSSPYSIQAVAVNFAVDGRK